MKTSNPVGDFLKHIINRGGVRKKRGPMSHSSPGEKFQLGRTWGQRTHSKRRQWRK